MLGDELLAAIVADPEDVAAHLVYADWLSEQGDPRGELIALHARLAEGADEECLHALMAHLQEHKATFLGPLEEEVMRAETGQPTDGLELHWNLGFIQNARIGRPELTGNLDAVLANLEDVLKHDSCRLLQELVIGDITPSRWIEYGPLVERLAELGPHTTILRFQLGDLVRESLLPDGTLYIERDISAIMLGDVEPLWSALPRLQELVLHGNHLELGVINAPQLRSLEICSSDIKDGNLSSIIRADLPALERLVLWLGDGEYGEANTLEAITELLGKPMPSLRHFGLVNSELADDICRQLATSPLREQIRVLDLSMGTMTTDGALALAKTSFPVLEKLIVTENYIDATGIEALQGWCSEVISAGQSDPGADRYVAVSE